MKAYVLHAVDDLRYEDVPMPECPEGWAIVRVRAAGICSSDIARVFTKGTYHFPTIPGHEFSGIVDSVGSETDKDMVGRHVGVFPLIPCRECPQCEARRYEMCEHYDYVGSRRDGGYAEFVAVPVWNLVTLSPSISFKDAAMLEPLAVGLHAARIGGIRRGQSVGVVGTGMIGICAAQWAKTLGADGVTVVGRGESKRPLVEKASLGYVVEDKADGAETYDVVVEAVGTPAAIDLAINLVKPGGTLVVMGNPSGDILVSQNTYWRILRKQLTLRGTWNSSYDGHAPSDWTEVVEALERREIKVGHLVSHVFSQDRLMDGLNLMRRHETPYCKVMTLWGED